ncbi:hypothetical protein HD554DRAFT_2316687 [Boletus coccyginus]|nr:hypothetical protein HD554DRAFT_2316687 [Boletus coccyginus]
MSFLPNIRPSSRDTPESSTAHEHDTASESRPTPDRNHALTWPATRSTSHQPSEVSGSTMLGGFYDGDKFDNASSVTLQGEFPWHEVGVNKCTQRIPSTIVPALLQEVSNVSPSRSSLCREEGGSYEVDEDPSDSEDVVSRYSAAQKGKWKAQTDGDVMHGSHLARSPSPQFHFENIHNPVEDWVIHTRPILQDYANRQTSLPLGRRLEVSIDEPPQFILGAIQLLVNRDKRGCTDRSRQLGPQLIENFVDIDRWAKEYFRSRHSMQVVDSDVPALLTIVMNNFYEGQVQLIDRLVDFALENMRFCGRSSLCIEDFSFGFDFKMSQDLPFYVETSSQIREPLPIPAVEVRPASEPVTTNSGRQVKPTERAQAASEQAQANASGRRNKGKNTSQLKGKQALKGSVQLARQKKNPAQPSSQSTVQETFEVLQAEPHVTTPVPPKTTSERTKHRPTQPSNLGLPPILPGSSSTAGTTPSQLDDSSKRGPAPAPAESPKVSGSSGSKLTVNSLPRLKIILPAPLPAPTVPATSGSESTLANPDSSTSQMTTSETMNMGGRAPRCGGTRPRGPRNARGRGRGRGSTSLTPSAETPGATADNTKALQPAGSVDVDDAEASAAVNPPTLVYALRSAVRTNFRTRSRGTDNSIGARDHVPSSSRSTRRSQSLLTPTDPGHPQGKKRKLDDCED